MSQHQRAQLFTGNSEMAKLMRKHDWSETTFGAVATWPQSLRSALSICLNSRFPIAIYWGKEGLLLYNDAWRPIVGNKHPWALGRPAQEVWSEIWDDIGPELALVLATGEGTFHNDELLSMHRFGYTEECFFDYTFNPIQGEGGVVEGVFNVVSETTYRVLNDRRAKLLREVASRTSIAKTTEAACQLMVEAFQSDPYDIPFALLYLLDQDGKAHLCGSTEAGGKGAGEQGAGSMGEREREEHPSPRTPAAFSEAPPLPEAPDSSISPKIINLAEDDDCWSIAHVVRTAQSQVIDDLVSRFGTLPGSPWREPPQEAMVLPIAATVQSKVTGVLVAVASPRRRLDDHYRDFLVQVAGQIGMAIANARSYEEERKKAEALAELDRAKTLFFSNISHEFRTPLTLMLSPLEELSHTLNGQLQPEQREQLELIQRNGLRLQKLVNTLLDFSRIEAGRVQASYEATDLATYTAELASVFRSLIEQAQINLVIDCPPLPEPIYIDREMWEKIVFNLLSNAFKFTFTGSITVKLKPVDNFVELSVIDTGVGIPEAELPRLFERFHRVSGTKSRTYEGSGIGLALVQELVKLHGGTIQVTSQENCGTTFTISIPFGSAHLPAERIQATRIASTLEANPYIIEASRWLPNSNIDLPMLDFDTESEAGSKGAQVNEYSPPYSPAPLPLRTSNQIAQSKILLADDNADMREYLKRLLSQQYEVETVADGSAALTKIRQQMPDLVLSDVMMPGIDGFELLRLLRTDPQTTDLPIILLSARAGEESRIEGLEAGADDYLIKPFSVRELLARVEATLKLSRLREESLQREQRLRRESEAAFRRIDQLLESMSEAFIALDHDWRIIYQNAIAERINNKPRSEVLGKTLWEEWPAAVGSISDQNYRYAVENQVAVHFEQHYYEPPDHDVWLEVNAYPFEDGLGIFYRDISDRKLAEAMILQREAQFRQLAEAMPQQVWMTDAQGVTQFVNQQWIDYTGLSVEQSHDIDYVAHVIHPDDFEATSKLWKTSLTTGEPYQAQWRLKHHAGDTYRWFLSRAIAIRNEDGKIVQWFGTSTDIEDFKRAQAEREELLAREQKAREEAEAANRVKDQFLAVLSHELRSPLNPILGWSKLLQQRSLDAARTKNALATIERNALLQVQLIDDLLDISRILRGKLCLEAVPVDLSVVITSALETVRLAAEARSMHIKTVLSTDSIVIGDAGRLQQVVWNLLSNAVKFSPTAGQITVTLSQIDSHAEIQVTDTGKGIAAEFLPHVFEHFRQEDSATTRKFGGLGLGLAIARQIVEMHGGQIMVDSPGEGLGATFTVQIPLASGLKTPLSPEIPSASTFDLRGMQILVVDDEEDSREFVAFVLEQAGAIITSVASGVDALQKLEQNAFNLVVSDIGMPEMDGYMLMQQIRLLEQGKEIPAIALTAYAGEYDQRQAYRAGFGKHLSKPVEIKDLMAAIQVLCKGVVD